MVFLSLCYKGDGTRCNHVAKQMFYDEGADLSYILKFSLELFDPSQLGGATVTVGYSWHNANRSTTANVTCVLGQPTEPKMYLEQLPDVLRSCLLKIEGMGKLLGSFIQGQRVPLPNPPIRVYQLDTQPKPPISAHHNGANQRDLVLNSNMRIATSSDGVTVVTNEDSGNILKTRDFETTRW